MVSTQPCNLELETNRKESMMTDTDETHKMEKACEIQPSLLELMCNTCQKYVPGCAWPGFVGDCAINKALLAMYKQNAEQIKTKDAEIAKCNCFLCNRVQARRRYIVCSECYLERVRQLRELEEQITAKDAEIERLKGKG